MICFCSSNGLMSSGNEPLYEIDRTQCKASKICVSSPSTFNPKCSPDWRLLGYISMPKFRPFLPCVHKERPRNLKFDQFHFKVVPKGGKSTDHDWNLNSSEGGQNTPACQISGHSFHTFSRKCPETSNFTGFTKSKWCQKEENQQTEI